MGWTAEESCFLLLSVAHLLHMCDLKNQRVPWIIQSKVNKSAASK